MTKVRFLQDPTGLSLKIGKKNCTRNLNSGPLTRFCSFFIGSDPFIGLIPRVPHILGKLGIVRVVGTMWKSQGNFIIDSSQGKWASAKHRP